VGDEVEEIATLAGGGIGPFAGGVSWTSPVSQ
jgi:hypothetical protein